MAKRASPSFVSFVRIIGVWPESPTAAKWWFDQGIQIAFGWDDFSIWNASLEVYEDPTGVGAVDTTNGIVTFNYANPIVVGGVAWKTGESAASSILFEDGSSEVPQTQGIVLTGQPERPGAAARTYSKLYDDKFVRQIVAIQDTNLAWFPNVAPRRDKYGRRELAITSYGKSVTTFNVYYIPNVVFNALMQDSAKSEAYLSDRDAKFNELGNMLYKPS